MVGEIYPWKTREHFVRFGSDNGLSAQLTSVRLLTRIARSRKHERIAGHQLDDAGRALRARYH